jgi:hypothetical protein
VYNGLHPDHRSRHTGLVFLDGSRGPGQGGGGGMSHIGRRHRNLHTRCTRTTRSRCLALTCRALRDALWAHFPRLLRQRPRGPAPASRRAVARPPSPRACAGTCLPPCPRCTRRAAACRGSASSSTCDEQPRRRASDINTRPRAPVAIGAQPRHGTRAAAQLGRVAHRSRTVCVTRRPGRRRLGGGSDLRLLGPGRPSRRRSAHHRPAAPRPAKKAQPAHV